MSNLSKFMKGGKKKDVPAEPAVPKPIAAAPLVEPYDKAKTRQVDLSAIAEADAAQASEDEVTVEVSGKGRAPAQAEPASFDEAFDSGVTHEIEAKAPPLYPSAPPKPVPPVAAPAKVVSISMAKAAPAASLAEDADEAGGESPEQSAQATQAAEKPLDTRKLLEQIKATVDGLLSPIRERLSSLESLGERVSQLEESLRQNDEMLDSVIEEINGPAPDSDEAGQAAEECSPRGISAEVASLSSALSGLRTQLLGPDPAETLAQFEGAPIVPTMLEHIIETSNYTMGIVGKDGERIPSIVDKITLLDAKTIAIELLKDSTDPAKVRQAAIEAGPDTAKDILAALATEEAYSVQVVGALMTSPAECLDDPANADLQAQVYAGVRKIAPKSAHFYHNLDWNAMEAEAAENRRPGLEPEQTGGDE